MLAGLALLHLAAPAAAQTTDFESAIRSFENKDARYPPPQGALVVTGSSSIRLWSAIRNDLAPLEVLPRGFGGSTADDLLFYLDRIVLPHAPRAVVIYEGDHDLQVGMTAEFILDRMAQIVARIGTELPEARIYLIAVKPSPKFWSLWPKAVELNGLVQSLCFVTPRCTYIDPTAALLGANGKFVRDYYRADRVHFDADGYAVWLSVLGPALMQGEGDHIVLPELRSREIGNPEGSGAAIWDGGAITVYGTGSGVSGTSDAFHFAWRQLTGNGQITVRVDSQTALSGAPAAGIMFREHLTSGARYAFAFTTPSAGAGMSWRTSAGGSSAPDQPQKPAISAPYWLRLVRKAGTILCTLSANGISWSDCGKVKLDGLKKTLYVGLAVASGSDASVESATFDNVWIQGNTGFPAPSPGGDTTPPTVPANVSALAAGPDTIQLTWNASADAGTGVAGYRVYRDGSPAGTSTGTVFVDGGLAPGTNYTYTVQAFDAAVPANVSAASEPSAASTDPL